MKISTAQIRIRGVMGRCGGLDAFLGFAKASTLHAVSFADTLNEDTGQGYQRPRSRTHSLDFKRYISQPDSSTIPLTFNLRPDRSHAWKLERHRSGYATLHLSADTPVLAQVDCQHRLGELCDSNVPLAFMTFIGLDLRGEMSLFVVINSKAKGLSSSLTDFHESNLLNDLATEAPHLFIARKLNEDPASPWYRMIRYGGESTSGLKRRTSFRMMQKTVSRFLVRSREAVNNDLNAKYSLVRSFWQAVAQVFPTEWEDPRHHLLTKGVGLYSLTGLLTDFVNAAPGQEWSADDFVGKLTPFAGRVDWGTKGAFADAGGQKGAMEIYQRLKKVLVNANSSC